METVVQYSKIAALSVALLGAALSTTALASDQDLGVLGPTWEIVEPDMRLAIVAEAHGVDWDSVNEHLAGASSKIIRETSPIGSSRLPSIPKLTS